jgi:hypothetical protein
VRTHEVILALGRDYRGSSDLSAEIFLVGSPSYPDTLLTLQPGEQSVVVVPGQIDNWFGDGVPYRVPRGGAEMARTRTYLLFLKWPSYRFLLLIASENEVSLLLVGR